MINSEDLLIRAEGKLASFNNIDLQAELNRQYTQLYSARKNESLAADYKSKYDALIQRKESREIIPQINPTTEIRAQQYEDDALIQIEKNKNQLLAKQQANLRSIDQIRQQQLREQQSRLQQNEVVRQGLVEETTKQSELIAQQQQARTQDQAELDRLQQLGRNSTIER